MAMGEGGDWGDGDWNNKLEPVNWGERNLQDFKCAFLDLPEKEDPEAEKRRAELAVQVHEHSALRAVPSPAGSFKDLCIPEYALKGLKEHRISAPLPLQAQALPLALRGCDLRASSPIGTGKRLAYLLPAIVHIEAQEKLKKKSDEEKSDRATPIALVLAATREEATQIEAWAQKLLRHSREGRHRESGGVWCACVQDSMKRSQLSFADPHWSTTHLVVAMASRLAEFVQAKVISLERVSYFVVDSADHMIADKLQGAVLAISGQVRPDRQTLVFANDWSEEVGEMAKSLCTAVARRGAPFARISAEASRISARIGCMADDLKKRGGERVHEVIVMEVPEREDREEAERRLADKEARLLEHLKRVLAEDKDNKALVFVSDRGFADHLALRVRQKGEQACAFHGGKVQESRLWMVDKFKRGDLRVMVATDVVGRNIEVPVVSHVVLFEVATIEEYVTKVCRPARSRDGKGQVLVFFQQLEDFPELAPDLVALLENLRQRVPDDLRRAADEQLANGRSRTALALAEGRGGADGAGAGRSCSSGRSRAGGRQGTPAKLVEREPSRSTAASATSSRTCTSPDRRDAERRRRARGARPSSARRNVPRRRRLSGRSRGGSARRPARGDRRKTSATGSAATARPDRHRQPDKQQAPSKPRGKSGSTKPAASADRGSSATADAARARTRTPTKRGGEASPRPASGLAAKAAPTAPVSAPVPGAGAKARPSLPAASRKAAAGGAEAKADADGEDASSNRTNLGSDEESSTDVPPDRPQAPHRDAATPGRPGPTNALVPKGAGSPKAAASPTGAAQALAAAVATAVAAGPAPKAAGAEERKPKPLPQPQAKKSSLPPPKEKQEKEKPGGSQPALPQPLAAAAQQARSAARAERALDEAPRLEAAHADSSGKRHKAATPPSKKRAATALADGAATAGAGSLSGLPQPTRQASLHEDVFAEAEERMKRLGLPGRSDSRGEAELRRKRSELEQMRAQLDDREAQIARREQELQSQAAKLEERAQQERSGEGRASASERAMLMQQQQGFRAEAARERAALEKERSRLEVQAQLQKERLDEEKRRQDEKNEEVYAELENKRAALEAQQAAAQERAQAKEAKDNQEAQSKLVQQQASLDAKAAELAGQDASLRKRKDELAKKEDVIKFGVKKLEARFTQENERQAVHREDMKAMELRHKDSVAREKELLERARQAHDEEVEMGKAQLTAAEEKRTRALAEMAKAEANALRTKHTISQALEQAEAQVKMKWQQIEEAQNKVREEQRQLEQAKLGLQSESENNLREAAAEREKAESTSAAARVMLQAETTKMQQRQQEMDRRQAELDQMEGKLRKEADELVRNTEELDRQRKSGQAENAQFFRQEEKLLRDQAAEDRRAAAAKREEAERQAAAVRAEAESVRKERDQLAEEREELRRDAKDNKKEKGRLAQERADLEREVQERVRRQLAKAGETAKADGAGAADEDALRKREQDVADQEEKLKQENLQVEATKQQNQAQFASWQHAADQREATLNETLVKLQEYEAQIQAREQALAEREQAAGVTDETAGGEGAAGQQAGAAAARSRAPSAPSDSSASRAADKKAAGGGAGPKAAGPKAKAAASRRAAAGRRRGASRSDSRAATRQRRPRARSRSRSRGRSNSRSSSQESRSRDKDARHKRARRK